MQVAKCADCGETGSSLEMYYVEIPPERQEQHGGARSMYICMSCWDRLVGLAAWALLR